MEQKEVKKDLLELEETSLKKNENLFNIIDKNKSTASNNENRTKPDFKSLPVNSGILDRVKMFLPTLERANKELNELLQTQPKENLNMETVSENAESYIEMDLALGVFEEEKEMTTETIKLSANETNPIVELFSKNFDSEEEDSEEEDERDG